MKRAAIYVRVSSERQAEGVSPEAQEADCRSMCQRQGYQVVEVYRDTEKYRVRGRIVEPSGTRSDRPQFLRMLRDADGGKFDVLIAWREDRLYRGVTRSVIDLKERVKAGVIAIEIVNGGFNPHTMEVLAWAAGVENEARVERSAMGMAKRLADGKMHLPSTIYGYAYSSEQGTLTIDEPRATWVRHIWTWYGTGVGRNEIRRRLIAADAPQSLSMDGKRKHSWARNIVDAILKRDEYHTGIFITTFGGQSYEAQIPPIIDAETFGAVKRRINAFKAYPAGNMRASALVAGMIYCKACGRSMAMKSSWAGNRQNGKKYVYYRCYGYNEQTASPGCAKTIRQDIVDAEVWRRVWAMLSEPERFEQALQARISQLQLEEVDAAKDVSNLERLLDDVLLERQRVIGFARKGLITEDDLETQLLSLTMQEQQLRRELSEKRLLTGNRVDRLMEVAAIYRQNIQAGMDAINSEPRTETQATRQFELRRKIVEALVSRVVVNSDKSISVEVEIDFPLLSINDTASAHRRLAILNLGREKRVLAQAIIDGGDRIALLKLLHRHIILLAAHAKSAAMNPNDQW